jgi:hypothetical protein
MQVTYALKHQLALLLDPWPELGWPAIVLTDPLVDVRIAAWILVEGSICEERSMAGRTGRRSLTKSLEELMERRDSTAATAAAVKGLNGHGAPGGGFPGSNPSWTSYVSSGMAACKRACMAQRMYADQLPILKVCFSADSFDDSAATMTSSNELVHMLQELAAQHGLLQALPNAP